MAIQVNIGAAKTRLSELVAASERGEEVILAKAGKPVARLVAEPGATSEAARQRAVRRLAALGMFRAEFEGYDLGPDALKQHRQVRD